MYQPCCKLRISLPANPIYPQQIFSDPLENVQSLRLLRSSQCLVSLAVRISSRERELFSELQAAVLSCPNIKSLAIHALAKRNLVEPPVMVSGWPWTSPQPGEGIAFPPLLELELHNFCICEKRDQYRWLRSFNWALLTRATFNCTSFITVLGEQLAGLKYLNLKLKSSCRSDFGCSEEGDLEQVKRFLFQCYRLEELELINCTKAIDEELLKHLGQSVKVIRLHEYEVARGVCQRPVLSDSQLQQLGLHCPLVEKLAIDIAYQNAWVNIHYCSYKQPEHADF